MRRASRGVLVLLSLVAACASPTQLDLVIDADADLRASIDTIEVIATADGDPAGTDGARAHVFGERAPLALPLRAAVAPADKDPARGIDVIAIARDATGGELARALVHGRFTDGERAEVRLSFARCCATTSPCVDVEVDEGVVDVDAPILCETVAGAPPGTVALLAPDHAASTGSVYVARSLTPTFRWAPVPGATRYELALEDDCAGMALADCAFDSPRMFETAVTELIPDVALAVSMTPPVGARYAWRVRACNESGCGPWSASRALDVGRLAHDLDGDGYADVVVAAPSASGGTLHAFFGGEDGLATTAGVATDDPAPSVDRTMGDALAVADLDGDGRAEIVVASTPRDATSSEGGRVYVLSLTGGADAPALTRVATLAPTDDDPTYGASVVVGGDIDGDGFRDVLVGAPGSGVVDLHRTTDHGVDDSPSLVLAGEGPSFGAQLASDLDANGDGRADVVVTDLFTQSIAFFSVDATGAFDPTPLARFSGDGRDGLFDGAGLRALGDVDGDGRRDLALAAPRAGARGTALIFTARAFDSPRFAVVSALDTASAFASSIANAGDVDGDGADESLIGAPDVEVGGVAGRGVAYVWSSVEGGRFVPLGAPTLPTDAHLGAHAGWVGDVDGDGFDEVAVSAPGAATVLVYRMSEESVRAATPAILTPSGARTEGSFGVLPP